MAFLSGHDVVGQLYADAAFKEETQHLRERLEDEAEQHPEVSAS